ncbi:MAG: outer membrane beta-barrel protein [Bacteroidota bacterium]
MKKLLIVLLVACFGTNIHAGDDGGLRFGINADPQLSWFSVVNDNSDPEGVSAGFNFGFFFDYFFAKNYAFNTGINLNNVRGNIKYDTITFSSLDDDATKTDATYKYKLQYVKLPIGLKFLSNEIGYMKFYAHVGTMAEFNVSSKMVIENKEQNIQDDVALFNASYYFGGGIEYSLGGSTALCMGLIFQNGFMDVTTNKVPDDKSKLINLSLRLGIVF